jgi:3-dehydroquinate synthetase
MLALELPVEVPPVSMNDMVDAMRVDKKARGDILTIPVSSEVGSASLFSLPVSRLPELVAELS